MKVERLRTIEQEIASGTTAVISLIYGNKVFVANVGNSRAVLCTTDANGRLHVQQVFDFSFTYGVLYKVEVNTKYEIIRDQLDLQPLPKIFIRKFHIARTVHM